MKTKDLDVAERTTLLETSHPKSDLSTPKSNSTFLTGSVEPTPALLFLTPLVQRIEHALEKMREAETTQLTTWYDKEASVSKRPQRRPRFDLD